MKRRILFCKNAMPPIGKIKNRCPRCKSTEIYKRTRINDLKDRNNYRLKSSYLSKKKISVKVYICRNCNNEFDYPFFGPK